GGDQVIKPIREMCVFARHNLTQDPPFSRMDLISCRNVLIYLQPILQRKVLDFLHYALKPTGFLILGKSEGAGASENLFVLEDRKANVYSKLQTVTRPLPEFRMIEGEKAAEILPSTPQPAPLSELRKTVQRMILDRYAPSGLIVDSRLRIIHFQGDTSSFLRPASGEPSFDLLKLVRPELMLEIRAAVKDAKKLGTPARREGISFKRNGKVHQTDIEIVPIESPTGKGMVYLVLFQNQRPSVEEKLTAASAQKATRRAEIEEKERLREQVTSLQDQLRSLMEDHEAATEELRAANEEILSSNEELQSTNEELQTAKEELQSTNEELTTLNEELQNRNIELSQTASDLNSLLNAVEIPIVILGNDRSIRRFTPTGEKLLNLIPSDVGRPISQIRTNVEIPDLDQMASEVIERGVPVEREVRDQTGHWYALRMRPFLTAENRIEGILIVLVDIHDIKQYATAIVETMRGCLLVLDSNFRILLASPGFYKTFEVKREETENRLLWELGNGQWNILQLRELLEKVLPEKQEVVDYEVEHDFPSVGRKTMLLSARQLYPTELGPPKILLVIEDITERRIWESQLQASESRARALLESAAQAILAVGPDGRMAIVNTTAEQMFGYTRDDLLGQPLEMLLPEGLRDTHRQHRAEFFAHPGNGPMGTGLDLSGRRKDGSEFPIEVSLSYIESPDAPLAVAFVSDITARKAAEENIHQLLARLVNTSEDARKRIARELHDSFGSGLAGLNLRISEMEGQLSSRPGLANKLKEIRNELSKFAKAAHDLSQQLHPSVLSQLGLKSALEAECAGYSKKHGVTVDFSAENISEQLPDPIALCLYRVAQESLENVRRHAQTKKVSVKLARKGNEIVMVIRDFGKGFDLKAVRTRGGLGLVSMEERVRLVDGSLSVTSKPGEGTRVEVHIPLEK
ncbi:MAG: PAS domain S-box protein, partial [Acidobacteriota bacterium]